ncbi:lipopolysaccharide assembly protein LapA domain-containing protein [Yersinia bercovieri]|uniref:lipopolysaccharide assembly protein LapA domain-containing protein n=1 Tax=Yersinia bercovieri TaxID=634 RepID=UPI0011A3F216|nr:LapA family protein [Yersinia bercovieri]
MKYLYGGCFLLIVTLTTLFAFQNSGSVNLSLLYAQITLPISVLIVLIYFLGMFTGGLLITLIRALVRRMSQEKVAQKTDKKV